MYDEKNDVMENVRKQQLEQMEQMSRNGVRFYVDGRAVPPAVAVSKAVREDSPYMADYVLNADGAIEQVRFDRVTRR